MLVFVLLPIVMQTKPLHYDLSCLLLLSNTFQFRAVKFFRESSSYGFQSSLVYVPHPCDTVVSGSPFFSFVHIHILLLFMHYDISGELKSSFKHSRNNAIGLFMI